MAALQTLYPWSYKKTFFSLNSSSTALEIAGILGEVLLWFFGGALWGAYMWGYFERKYREFKASPTTSL